MLLHLCIEMHQLLVIAQWLFLAQVDLVSQTTFMTLLLVESSFCDVGCSYGKKKKNEGVELGHQLLFYN